MQPLGARHILALVDGLHPRTSAYARATLGPARAEWDQGVEWQATTVELLQQLAWMFEAAHSERRPSWRIERIARPFDTSPSGEPARRVSLAQFASILTGGTAP